MAEGIETLRRRYKAEKFIAIATLNAIQKELERRDSWQGKLYRKNLLSESRPAAAALQEVTP